MNYIVLTSSARQWLLRLQLKWIAFSFAVVHITGGQLLAQEASVRKESSLFLAGGISLIDYQDLVFSESIYEGSGLSSLEFGYQLHGERSIINTRLAYMANQVEPENLISSDAFGQRPPSSFAQIALNFSYAYRVFEKSRLKAYGGLQLQGKYMENTMVFGLGEETSYAFLNTLGPELKLFYTLPKSWELYGRFSVPIAAFIARPEYAVVDNEDIQGKSGFGLLYGKGDLVSLGDYSGISLTAQLNHDFNRRLTGFLAYQFEYHKISFPAIMYLQISNIKLGINFHL